MMSLDTAEPVKSSVLSPERTGNWNGREVAKTNCLAPLPPPAEAFLQEGKDIRDDSPSQKEEPPATTLVKRTFCKFWQENKCTKGDACTFAHGDHEIGQPIHIDSCWAPAKQGNDVSVSRKKIICKFWQEGKCSKGPGCTFAHGDQELGQPINAEMARLFASRRSDLCNGINSGAKSTLCKFWQEGKCTKGESCTFSHGLPTAAREGTAVKLPERA
ncbi:unnamed protein product [Effrenium voratum]|nr:unnamed protein product [Effrenium voratum]